MLLLIAPFFYEDVGAANVAVDYQYANPESLTQGTNAGFVTPTDPATLDTSPAILWGWTQPALAALDPDFFIDGVAGTAVPVDSATVVVDTGGCYTSRYLLNAMYGKQNIDEWANLENYDEDQNAEQETAINARIELENERVNAYIDDSLQYLYCTPFPCPAPRTIEAMATAMVGHNLRDARYMNEDDPVVLRKYERAMNTLHQLKEGSIRTTGFRAKTFPSFSRSASSGTTAVATAPTVVDDPATFTVNTFAEIPPPTTVPAGNRYSVINDPDDTLEGTYLVTGELGSLGDGLLKQ